jgi:hypothetical protein
MTMNVQDPRTEPIEALIPEARHHQRRRYARGAVALAVCAVLAAGLTGAAVIFFGPASGSKAQVSPVTVVDAHPGGQVYFRPVLCTAPLYNPSASTATTSGLSCSAASALTAQNLNVSPGSSPAGFSTNNVAPDQALADVPSTTPAVEKASETVLVPAVGPQRNDAVRYVLGPAEMTSRLIKAASVERTGVGAWVINYTMNSAGSALWDKVAQENFHQEIGIDLDGVVYSTPLIQPAQSSFSSFEGRGEISGSLTKAEAIRLAHALHPRSTS